jgi:hypothetical protein
MQTALFLMTFGENEYGVTVALLLVFPHAHIAAAGLGNSFRNGHVATELNYFTR